jgi:carotenoid 1,2-hydratase
MNRIELPERSGAYRWYYVDVTAGDLTAVFIFMVGSPFSARYAATLDKGGLPREHAAVNFALYEKGVRRLWVLTEYAQASVSADERTLQVGDSSLQYQAQGLSAEVNDRTTPFMVTRWGRPTQVALSLTPAGPSHDELRLVDGLEHFWRPIAARARARVQVKSHGLDFEGAAYHDGNHGLVPLGRDLRGWEWARVHGPEATVITYRPHALAPSVRVQVTDTTATSTREVLPTEASQRTRWGLRVPASLGLGTAPALMESSPFYARAEAREGQHHALGEVADFQRFHRPSVRWMARFRTRVGGTA